MKDPSNIFHLDAVFQLFLLLQNRKSIPSTRLSFGISVPIPPDQIKKTGGQAETIEPIGAKKWRLSGNGIRLAPGLVRIKMLRMRACKALPSARSDHEFLLSISRLHQTSLALKNWLLPMNFTLWQHRNRPYSSSEVTIRVSPRISWTRTIAPGLTAGSPSATSARHSSPRTRM